MNLNKHLKANIIFLNKFFKKLSIYYCNIIIFQPVRTILGFLWIHDHPEITRYILILILTFSCFNQY